MSKFRFNLNLQFFADEGAPVESPGVESVPAAEVQEPSQTGVESTGAAEPEKNNFEKAMAKRIAQEREKHQAELEAERAKYKDYDALKSVAEYFREVNQAPDILTLKEQIEMQRLQQQAEERNLPVEELKRMRELEAKAAKADEYERQMQEETRIKQEQEQQQQQFKEFRSKLETFAKDKGIDADKLHQFMYENSIGNLDAAYKAMRHDELVQEMENAKKTGVKEFLSAKSKIPTVPSTNQTGQVVSSPPKTFAEARARAMQRLSGE